MTIPHLIGIDDRAKHPLGGIEPMLLLGCVVAYEAAFLTGRSFPASARTVLVLLAPLLAIRCLPHRWNRDRLGLIASGLMLAFVAWSVAQLAWATPMVEIAAGRAATMAAAVVLCWSVLYGRAPAEGLIVSIGVGATAALGVAITGMVMFDFPSFGLGNINHLLYGVTPGYCGWMAWLLVSVSSGRRPGAWQWVLAAVATAELVYASLFAVPELPRRGAMLAVALSLGCVGGLWLWNRDRRLFLVMAAVIAVLGAAAAWTVVHRHHGEAMARTERVLMYEATLQAIPQVMPWGAGLHGPLRQQDLDGEILRHQTATGLWMSDAHNALLEAFLDGGIVGGLLFVALVSVIAWRTLLIGDPALRAGAATIGLVLLLHAMTDNCYGMPAGMAWAGVLFGAMLKCPVDAPPASSAGVPGLRVAAWLLVGFCACAATREMSGAFMSNAASDAVRIRTLRQTWQVDQLTTDWRAGIEGAYQRGDMRACKEYLDIVGRRTEWTGGTLAARCLVDSRISEIALNRFLDGLAALIRQPTGSEAFARGWRALAAATTADADQAQALLRWIHRFPMGNFGYANLTTLLERRPDLSSVVPREIAMRIAYRAGRPDLPAPLLEQPTSIDAASDLYSRMIWCHLRGYGADRLSEPMRWLLRDYGDITEVYLLAMMLSRDAEPGAYAWLLDVPAMRRAFRPLFAIDFLALLKGVSGADHARTVWPLMRCIDPDLASSFESGRVHENASVGGTGQAVWEEYLRIWRLSRETSPGHPGASASPASSNGTTSTRASTPLDE